MKINICYGIIVLLLFLNITVILKLKRTYIKLENIKVELTQKSTEQSEFFEKIVNNFQYSQINNNLPINPEIELFDINNRKYKLRKLISSKPKLIVYFNTNGCSACLEAELHNLEESINKIGIQNVLIITTLTNARKLNAFKNSFDIKMNVYSAPNFEIPFSTEGSVFEFIIDNSFIVKDFFLPEKSIVALSKIYYNNLYDKYFSISKRLSDIRGNYKYRNGQPI